MGPTWNVAAIFLMTSFCVSKSLFVMLSDASKRKAISAISEQSREIEREKERKRERKDTVEIVVIRFFIYRFLTLVSQRRLESKLSHSPGHNVFLTF